MLLAQRANSRGVQRLHTLLPTMETTVIWYFVPNSKGSPKRAALYASSSTPMAASGISAAAAARHRLGLSTARNAIATGMISSPTFGRAAMASPSHSPIQKAWRCAGSWRKRSSAQAHVAPIAAPQRFATSYVRAKTSRYGTRLPMPRKRIQNAIGMRDLGWVLNPSSDAEGPPSAADGLRARPTWSARLTNITQAINAHAAKNAAANPSPG